MEFCGSVLWSEIGVGTDLCGERVKWFCRCVKKLVEQKGHLQWIFVCVSVCALLVRGLVMN